MPIIQTPPNMLGDSVTVDYYWPDKQSKYETEGTKTVTAGGVWFWGVLGYMFDVFIDPDHITLTNFYTDGSIAEAAFSGLLITDNTHEFNSVSVNASTDVVNFSSANVSVEGNKLWVNLSDIGMSGSITLDVSTKPSSKTDQTIAFTSLAPTGAVMGGDAYDPAASASSGLPVDITVDASSVAVCAIASGHVSFIGTGTCTLDANQAGNSSYNAAQQVQQSFSVGALTNASAMPSQLMPARTNGRCNCGG